ncbi:atp-dependent helicase [Fusarium austroafricanum]|uniref:Atp-dependent helicase n=1 Tax=Fusarium austroafricanum TaxID=2364996 RepID=A0A8H4JMB7_9HYPO|nr:atp-dependent helicase [Fusarium austroafricanum]
MSAVICGAEPILPIMLTVAAPNRPVPCKPLAPLYVLSAEEFVKRHENGTIIEQKNEETVLKRFNERRTSFKAWPVAPIEGFSNSFTTSWLFIVPVPKLSEDAIFPALTDTFRIDIEKRIHLTDGTQSLVNLPATRINNPYENLENLPCPSVAKCAAFKVEISRSWKNEDGEQVNLDLMASMRTASSLDDFESLTLDESKHQNIIITWETFSNTYEAELSALRRLTADCQLESRKVSPKCKAAFEMILDLKGSNKTFVNLHKVFPHLENPGRPDHRIRHAILRKFRSFNKDHLAAYNGLKKIPNGMYFVNGCPGAGKTEWNMVLSALIQSVRRPGAKKRCNPILFLVDLNKTVDDAADRYCKMTKEAGLNFRIIRMHGWPYEIRNSDKLNSSQPHDSTDFTQKFLATMNIHKSVHVERTTDKAPTLDEAAWEYYEKHKDGGFVVLKKVLARMEAKEVLNHENWTTLRREINKLYTAVLKQADFVATTPVAAYGSFSKLFKPDVIIMDEAPHARELTTLIPVAFFEPLAWIFTGDVNQTRPFVKSGDARDAQKKGLDVNPYAEQMRLSLMARASKVGAVNSSLLINKRAHGNLHQLPSDLFYDGKMSSGYPVWKRFPTTVSYLRSYLEGFGNGRKLDANRAIIALTTSKEETQSSSFWNPAHHGWVMDQVARLLQDPLFRSVTDNRQLGRVMIQTPYSVSMRQYVTAVKQWPVEWQERVEVLTVDKAQGNQADVVFLDMVRTTKPGFMDEAQRLNVAITRAKQAEIVLMHHAMTFRLRRGQKVPTDFTSKVWDDAVANNRLFVV